MDWRGGSKVPLDAMSARENHRASSNSSSCKWMSVVTACAMNPSIRDDGKGQGWDE